MQIEGKAYAQDSEYPLAREGIVTPGYFETFQTKLLNGREFTTSDTSVGQPVAIINESFARTHFPGIDAVGHQMKRIRPGSKEPWLTIVGIVPDLLMQGIGNNNASPVGYYIPIAQSDVANSVRIAVRTRGDAAAVTPQIRSAVTVPRLGARDLRDQRAGPGDRASDLVLHRVRHVLHGVRHLRTVPRSRGALWRDVVRRHAADA